jgi:hypothetical protein
MTSKMMEEIPEILIKKNIPQILPRLEKDPWKENQRNIIIKKKTAGTKKNRSGEIWWGTPGFLVKSFKASSRGCKIPEPRFLSGPFRF